MQTAEDPGPILKEKKPSKKERGPKKNAKEPRVKMYIPPVKPAPVQPDPLETTGLMHKLPPELLIVLRNLSKKAQVTKVRALEELQSAWVERYSEDGEMEYVLVTMLPVWVRCSRKSEVLFYSHKHVQLHHVSALFVHHSRRVRFLTAGIHASLLQISVIRDQILFFFRETASPSQLETILGTWCIAAHDIDRSVASTALNSWVSSVSVKANASDLTLDNHLPPLESFIQRTILDPSAVYAYLNPVQAPVVYAPQKQGPGGVRREREKEREDREVAARAKAEDMEENEQDRKARLRVGALGALRWILGILFSLWLIAESNSFYYKRR